MVWAQSRQEFPTMFNLTPGYQCEGTHSRKECGGKGGKVQGGLLTRVKK